MKRWMSLVAAIALCASSTLFATPPEKEKFILASKLSWSPEDAPHCEVKIPEKSSTPGGPPAVFKSGKWEYTYSVPSRHHSVGKLLYDGLIVKPDKKGQIIKSPFGSLRFFSLIEKRHLSGWFHMPKRNEKKGTEQSDGAATSKTAPSAVPEASHP